MTTVLPYIPEKLQELSEKEQMSLSRPVLFEQITVLDVRDLRPHKHLFRDSIVKGSNNKYCEICELYLSSWLHYLEMVAIKPQTQNVKNQAELFEGAVRDLQRIIPNGHSASVYSLSEYRQTREKYVSMLHGGYRKRFLKIMPYTPKGKWNSYAGD